MPADVDTPHTTAERRFLVVWQDPDTREFVQVGELVASDDGERTYEFRYTADAELNPRFRAFPAFPDLHRVYRQSELFAFFQNRVMSPRRPDYSDYLTALGLDPETPDPVEMLARTGGVRATDTIQVVPAPEVSGHRERLHFLASGVRHVDPEGQRLRQLSPGTRLRIRPDGGNDFDPRALLLDVRTEEPVGYIPSYLLDYVHKRLGQGGHIDIVVEQVNGPEVPAHLRLLCRMDVDVSAR